MVPNRRQSESLVHLFEQGQFALCFSQPPLSMVLSSFNVASGMFNSAWRAPALCLGLERTQIVFHCVVAGRGERDPPAVS
jgi:hypothetical protein